MTKLFNDQKVPVFLDDVPPVDSESYENYSFREESLKTMSFKKEFLTKLKDTSSAVMRARFKSNDK